MSRAWQRPRLKICGVTNAADARLVSEAGADYCGLVVEVGYSERSLSLDAAAGVARASTIPVVVLLCDANIDRLREVSSAVRPHAVQMLCHETPDFVRHVSRVVECAVWKSVHLPAPAGMAAPQEYVAAGVGALLIDAVDTSAGFERMGGTGQTVDWGAARAVVDDVSVPVFLAGGVNAENVEQALLAVRPDGIDLCSGVEATKGRKDPEKVRRLVKGFRRAAALLEKERV